MPFSLSFHTSLQFLVRNFLFPSVHHAHNALMTLTVTSTAALFNFVTELIIEGDIDRHVVLRNARKPTSRLIKTTAGQRDLHIAF